MLAWSWPAGTPFYVYGDPCQWVSTTPDTPATTVDELVAALATQTSRDASEPVDVTIGGHAGKPITLHVPDDAPTRAEAFKDCDQGTYASYGTAPAGSEPERYHQGPGQVDQLWILDVDGSIVIIDAMSRPSTPAELVEEMRIWMIDRSPGYSKVADSAMAREGSSGPRTPACDAWPRRSRRW